MGIKKVIGITIIALMMSGMVFAQGMPQGQGQGQGPDGAPPQGQGGPGGGDMVDNSNLNFHPAFDEMDKNKDAKVSKEEFMAGGFDDDAYDKLFQKMLNKNGDEFLTFEEFTSSYPQFEVDTDHDGKVSLKEFLGNNTKAAEEKGLRPKAEGAGSTAK